MTFADFGRGSALTLAAVWLLGAPARAADEDAKALAAKAHAVLKTHCYRCHGQDGAVEGGMNFVLDRDKLVARKKVIPGDARKSTLYQRVASGKMPPAGEKPRPTADDVEVLKKWIEGGAISARPANPDRSPVLETEVYARIRDDLETVEKRARRFTRYFSLAPQYNQGLSADELQTYRNALAKLLNSLSWHPRITLPRAVDRDGLVLR